MRKRMLLALACAAALTAVPVRAAQPITAVREMEVLPACWNPAAERTAEKEFLLGLTAAGFYTVEGATGEIVPLLAAALPRDVTADYAGNEKYGVPAQAGRGYAFEITLNPAACWEDGTAVTAEQAVRSLQVLLESGANLPEFANAAAFRRGENRPTGEIVSLETAGFTDVEEAGQAGYSEFYLDTAGFWGLDGGWRPVTDGTRLRDYAMPAGMDEMYVSAAYLYRNYLADGAPYSRFQREFVGVAKPADEKQNLDDVGILKTGERSFTLILARPTTASALALALDGVYLLSDGVNAAAGENCRSNGPYRVVSADAWEIVLEPNPCWWGSPAAYDRVVCRRAD